ncbi:calcium-dependent phosphotriesterase [Corynespora cassiicola Philippines]|uniref:Calcium-dependent phosphotriesterase n=1 Tax=Corynespora cassiicola Philippines TaxID=1448308 RepID=A0A2T2NCP9_CORCC|nr:calcium-dependent phosphotriesterase [Corynespora cassiicola Philippines]
MARVSLYLVLAAIVAPFLYDRYLNLAAMIGNRPDAFQNVHNVKSKEIKFRDRLKNCEDVLLVESQGKALLSCDAGRDRWNTVMGVFRRDLGHQSGHLWIYDYVSPEGSLTPLTLENYPGTELHPLGIEVDPSTNTLWVVNHAAPSPTLELFSLNLPLSSAAHIKTLSHPLLHAPNSIHAAGNGRLYVTNDHFFRAARYPLLSKVETWSGLPGGTVVYVDASDLENVSVRQVARVPFANGVAAVNASTLVVASSSRPGIYFFGVREDGGLEGRGHVRTPAAVDNLSVDGHGKVLVAGHPFAPGLFVTAKGRPGCMEGSEEEESVEACKCEAPSWAAEWSEEGGLREIYKDNGTEFCSSSTVVRDVERGVGMVSGLYDRGILVFKE